LSRRSAQQALAAHLDVAARHGVRLLGYERDGRVRYCYEGSAFRRVLAMDSSPARRARAALELTRPECMSADLSPAERRRLDEWRADVLDKVDASRLASIARNRVLVRRAAVWAGLAYRRARAGDDPRPAAARAQQALADVHPAELTPRDRAAYHEAALRVGASRWALAAAPSTAMPADRPHVIARTEASGQTCVLLADKKRGPSAPLAKRCTYGFVWAASQTLNREATALALAVQQTDAWRELWVFRKSASGWTVRVLPPSADAPEIGYAEFAGWVPGGRRMLVAREALGRGRRTRVFELLRLDTLAPVRHAAEPGAVAGFRRWQDPSWKGRTISLR